MPILVFIIESTGILCSRYKNTFGRRLKLLKINNNDSVDLKCNVQYELHYIVINYTYKFVESNYIN